MNNVDRGVVIVRDSNEFLKTADIVQYLTSEDVPILGTGETLEEGIQLIEEIRTAIASGSVSLVLFMFDMNLVAGEFSGNDGRKLIGSASNVEKSHIFSISSYDYNIPEVVYIGENPDLMVEKAREVLGM